MTLDDLKKEKIQAMKAKDADAVSALNVVINKLMLLTIEKRSKGETVTEADTVSVLQKSQKELIEERTGFEKAGRSETVESLNRQIAAVEKYLPKLLSDSEISDIIDGLEDKSIPYVMRYFKSEYAGKCDMAAVNAVLKSKK